MSRLDCRTELGIYTDKTIYYPASNKETIQSSYSAKDVQVSVVACTDLLWILWLEAQITNIKKLRQLIQCRGDQPRTSVAGTYQALPTQTLLIATGN